MSIYFEWTKEMSVGEDHIDEQHKKLLDQINKTIIAIVAGVSHEEILKALNFFEDYYEEHFPYEEEYMKKHSYPEIEEHKKRHEEFIKNYLELKEKFKSGASPDSVMVDIEKHLGEWWIEHIGKADQKYHAFINTINQ